MPAPGLTPAERARRLRAYLAAGSQQAAARRLAAEGPGTLATYRSALQGMTPEKARAELALIESGATPAQSSPVERHDSAFWRKRATEHQREAERLGKLVEELGGIRAVPVQPPLWEREASGKRHRGILIAHTSDLHMGEVIRAGEIHGVNAFDPEIALDRMRRFFCAVCEIGARWTTDTDCAGVLLTLAGDLISGDIHEELRITNALTAHEQVRAAVEVYEAGIRLLLPAWGRVHVVVVPGNHGRTTPKPTAKLAGALSYDTLIGSMLADRFRGEERVTWQADGSVDQITPVLGRTILTTHGDRIGTGGGHGFAGPVLPILRGTHKVRAQQASLGRPPDLILMGHYHTSAALPGVLANGSVPGYSEYGAGLRGGFEPPKQWLALMTERWGLRERLDVQLEEPPPPGKPRIRVKQRDVGA